MSLTYEDARRRARQQFGGTAEVRMHKPFPLLTVYEVGLVEKGVFTCFGAGNSWEDAFASVKPLTREYPTEGTNEA